MQISETGICVSHFGRHLGQSRCRQSFHLHCARFQPKGALTLSWASTTESLLQRYSEIGHVVCVQKRIQSRVEVRQDNEGVQQPYGYLASTAEGLDAVDGVQWHPAHHEEEHDDGQILGCPDFSLAGLLRPDIWSAVWRLDPLEVSVQASFRAGCGTRCPVAMTTGVSVVVLTVSRSVSWKLLF
ncbi:hypothetical protein CDAR_387181 [Caerostris darwini]|uniref:Uncharacterized protein n=1 Tax=Caerostris darwini TaxID=1538125 RepID=A0AAV4MWP7_9ARAC|nr:hypothetical protein CDAR_387181 [Caerostris darwini]